MPDDATVDASVDAAYLLLGPVLRYVDDTRATVWVETDRPCTVRVLGCEAATWTLHGHHYALVAVEGLPPASATPYEVHLDGVAAWPVPGSAFPPSVIRTPGGQRSLRLAMGSCRRSAPKNAEHLKTYGADALAALALRMAASPQASWPDALVLLGDQIYADMPSPEMAERLAQRHAGDGEREVREEIHDFEEYTWLYHESWNWPEVRWLLSTVPSCMILDDHDLRDDWNTSWSWREETSREPWWRDRVLGAFGSYWVYQHLGNLSPDELAGDELYGKVLAALDDDERGRLVDEFSWLADTEPEHVRWSFCRDFPGPDAGWVRLVVVDSRCSRRLDPDDRAMLDEVEWAWLVEHAHAEVDHLLVGTSLPLLMLHGIHDVEGWNEATAQGAWGRGYAWFGEQLRRLIDLEHWPAFGRSFEDMVGLLRDVALGVRTGSPPASVLVLSGDVHCSYLAEACIPGVDPARTRIHQIVQSPLRNPLELPVREVNRLLESRLVVAGLRGLARRAGVPEVPVTWTIDHGPFFDNGVMVLDLHGRRATCEVERAVVRDGQQVLERVATYALA